MPPDPSLRETVEFQIPGRLPSWNQILAMQHWNRAKFKSKAMADFESALRVSAADSSTKTTFAKNTLSTAADTLASYRETLLAKRKSKSSKGSAQRGKRKRSR